MLTDLVVRLEEEGSFWIAILNLSSFSGSQNRGILVCTTRINARTCCMHGLNPYISLARRACKPNFCWKSVATTNNLFSQCPSIIHRRSPNYQLKGNTAVGTAGWRVRPLLKLISHWMDCHDSWRIRQFDTHRPQRMNPSDFDEPSFSCSSTSRSEFSLTQCAFVLSRGGIIPASLLVQPRGYHFWFWPPFLLDCCDFQLRYSRSTFWILMIEWIRRFFIWCQQQVRPNIDAVKCLIDWISDCISIRESAKQECGWRGSFDLRLTWREISLTPQSSSFGDPHQIKWPTDWRLHPQALLLAEIKVKTRANLGSVNMLVGPTWHCSQEMAPVSRLCHTGPERWLGGASTGR